MQPQVGGGRGEVREGWQRSSLQSSDAIAKGAGAASHIPVTWQHQLFEVQQQQAHQACPCPGAPTGSRSLKQHDVYSDAQILLQQHAIKHDEAAVALECGVNSTGFVASSVQVALLSGPPHHPLY